MSVMDSNLANFVLEDLDLAGARETKNSLDSNTMGIRFPIWFAACNADTMEYNLAVPGSRKKATDVLRLASLSGDQCKRHPDLKFLAEHILKYMKDFEHGHHHPQLSKYSNVASIKAPFQYDILKDFLAFYPGKSAQIQVYSCLEMRHPMCEGVQRIRCYPFSDHQYNDRNIKDNIFLKPIAAGEHFNLPNDKDELQYAQVQLLFKCMVITRKGNLREVSLAFIKYYEKYTVRGKQWTSGGKALPNTSVQFFICLQIV